MNRIRQTLFTIWLVSLLQPHSRAEDWPQWRGVNRDGVWTAPGIVERFPKNGLPVKWRTPIHGGYSGPAVANGRVFVTDYVRKSGDVTNNPGGRDKLEGAERVLCLNADDGALVWKYEYDRPYHISYPTGPRATPTVDGDHVYALGAEGNLLCLQTATGQVLWSKELKTEYKTEAPFWGFAGHPLVDGRKLICLVGGEGSVAVALDKLTGKEIWRALSARNPAYAPPTIISQGGVRQLLIWHADELNGLDPETGKVHWSTPLKPDYDMAIIAPQQSGNLLFASGIGDVGALFKLDFKTPSIEVVWKGTPKTAVYCANSTPFIQDGVIFGVCCDTGALRAVDLKSGDRIWESFAATTGERRAGHGTAFLVKHQDRFFLFNETGDLILARLTPKGYDEISRFHVLEPTNTVFGRSVVWTHPAFANKCVYARNDKEIVCVSLAGR